MSRKTGVPTMLDEARSLQNHITNFQAFQAGFFDTNADLLNAIAACAGCLVDLITELSKVREKGD